jgi:hypothetical protein
MLSFAKIDLLLDDEELMGMDVEARTDLLDDRHGRRATLITSLPVRLSEHALDPQRVDDRVFRTFVQVWRWRFELGNRPVGKGVFGRVTPAIAAEQSPAADCPIFSIVS